MPPEESAVLQPHLYVAASGCGWGSVRVEGSAGLEDAGAERDATSYRAELLGVLSGLRRLGAGAVTIHAANVDIQLMGKERIQRWERGGWRKKGGPIEHLDLVRGIWAAMQGMETSWVLADRGVAAFARASALARRAARNPQPAPERETPPLPPPAAPSASRIVAYTDGGCRGNPGIGGRGFLLIDTETGRAMEGRGGERETTNNRMEMMGAIAALKALQGGGRTLEFRTDSKYLIGVGESWIPKWKRNGWRTSTGEEVKNLDLVQELDKLLAARVVAWSWVRGHSGEPGNEHADALTNRAMDDVRVGRSAAQERKFAVSPVSLADGAVRTQAGRRNEEGSSG